MAALGIRELRDNLSRCIRRVEKGEQIAVTAHGRVIARIVPPGSQAGTKTYEGLIAMGLVRPAAPSAKRSDPLAGWPKLRLPRGTAQRLIDEDRGDS
jgi:prevent-host-death family protein